MSKNVVDSYEAIVRLIKICSGVCGANVFNPAYKMNILTWIVMTFINLYFAFTGYTLYVNLYIERDWTLMLQIVCFLGSALQGYCKLLNAIWNKDALRYLVDELREMYVEYVQKHDEYRECLQKSINLSVKCIKFMAISHVAVVVGIIGVVPFYRLVHNQRVFVMQFLLPGIDPNTEYGYIIMNCMHCICIIFGAFGNFAADLCFFTFVSHFPLFKDILSCKFHDLNDLLEEEEENKEREPRDYKTLLRDIFQWHQKYMRYITTVKDNYFWVLLVEMVTFGLSIASTLFCLLLGTWPGGLTYLCYCFMMLYIYCGLGTVVEVTNDDFIDFCYTQVIWYKLPVAERKMLRMMLMMTQKTGGLTVGAVIPLTMNTGLQLTKMIYTMTMMLINFID
ncbi:odorant receptor 67d-like [Musca vetustissima]|uniref:odorant receptor 67d-like n=1 Tax=Musca vetustissima TaxID=27455 RepID=UPI002AB7498C|nr:odorant receptor 67d-like [Musca vetustissima]